MSVFTRLCNYRSLESLGKFIEYCRIVALLPVIPLVIVFLNPSHFPALIKMVILAISLIQSQEMEQFATLFLVAHAMHVQLIGPSFPLSVIYSMSIIYRVSHILESAK